MTRTVRAVRWVLFAVAGAVLTLGALFVLRPVEVFHQITWLKEPFQGIENRTMTIDGHRIHYEMTGPKDGRPIVLVHGLGGTAEDWLGLEPELVRAGYRVYVPEMPGYGRSERPVDFSYSIRDEATFIEHFMDAMGLKQTDLVGWSMGGAIVQHVAYRAPERIRHLVLMDALGLNVKPTWNVQLFVPKTQGELEQLNWLLGPPTGPVPGFVGRDVLRVTRERGWVIERAIAQITDARDATDQILPQLKMPTLVVWGDQDRIFPMDQAYTMQHLLPHAELVVVKGVGHMAPRDNVAQYAPQLISFLQR